MQTVSPSLPPSIRKISAAHPAGFERTPAFFPMALIRHRNLLRQLAGREIRARYEASSLGILWAFINPLVSLIIYTVVFGHIFKGRWVFNGNEKSGFFPLVLLCGLTTYNIFSESLNASTRIIVGNKNYVKKVVFPLEMLPITCLAAALYYGLFWFLIAVGGCVLMLGSLPLTLVALPLVLLPLVLFTGSICWFFASLGVYIRDVAHLVNILLLVMLYLSGIFYSPAVLPERWQRWIYLNPLALIVEQVRQVMIFGQWPHWGSWMVLLFASLVAAQLGYIWFIRTKKGFADVL